MGTGRFGGLPSEFLRTLLEDLQVANSWLGPRWCPGKRPTSVGHSPNRGADASYTPAPGQAPACMSGAVRGRAARSAPAWGHSASRVEAAGPRETHQGRVCTNRQTRGRRLVCARGFWKGLFCNAVPFPSSGQPVTFLATQMTYIYTCEGFACVYWEQTFTCSLCNNHGVRGVLG